ncbi:MAG: TetR/AcrR family transcriptional regulator [Myxococcota bacterium]
MARTRDEAVFASKQAEIRRAAEALFSINGFHNTGIAAICKAVGMSPGTLYRYYGSKDDIIRAIVEEDQLSAVALFDQLGEQEDFHEGLIDALLVAVGTVSQPDYASIFLEVAAEGSRNPQIGALLERSRRALVDRLAASIVQAMDRGQVPDGIDAEMVSHLLIAIPDGLAGSGSPPDPGAARLRAVLRGLVHGVLGRR